MLHETQAWNIISDCVEAYLEAVRGQSTPPSIDPFIPPDPGPVRNLAIIELAKVEMEVLCAAGVFSSVREYVTRYPELAEVTGGLPVDLIFEEIRLRLADQTCTPDAFVQQYPQHKAPIERFFQQMGLGSATASRMQVTVHAAFCEGETFGDFEILKLLGTGAFAKVYLARQTTMQRLVALKVSADRGDEAKTLAQLDHPNVVRVFDVRCLPEKKLRLLSMQYVPGGTLADVVRFAQKRDYHDLDGSVILQAIDAALLTAEMPSPEDSPRRTRLATLGWAEAVCELGIQLADALDYAHRHKVLHRDVKPANVLLSAECMCKLADFNISYAGNIAGTNPASYFGGSLSYMSPEQLRAATWNRDIQVEDLDERSDVFSLACVLWELLTVQRPWPNDQLKMDWMSTIDEISRRRADEPPALAMDAPTNPTMQRVVQCLRSALAHDRNLRTSSASILAGQLRLCLSQKAWRLLHPESGRWSLLACEYPTWVALAAVFIPNGLAGAFNYHYNDSWMGNQHSDGHEHLVEVSVLINFLAFGMGGVFFLFVVWPITREVAKRIRGDRSRPSLSIQRALLVGHRAAIFGLALWLTAGIVFPVMLSMRMATFNLQDAIHFFLSLAICGAIAVSYPFLGMSLLAVQTWFGVLAGNDLRDPEFRERGATLMRWCDLYLLTATSVPLAGLAMLLMQESPVRTALTILVAASAIGLFLAFRVHRLIQESIAALTPILAPNQPH